MTLFWILASALVVAALTLLVRPLLRGGGAGGRSAAPDAARAPALDSTRESNLRILREQLTELDAELASGALAADQHAAARAELERRALEETRQAEVTVAARPGHASALALAVLLPALAVVLYLALGNPTAFDPVLAKAPSEATPADVEVLVERLAQRMREQPGDPEGWALLGRSYAAMGRFEPARDAYAKAVALLPDNAWLLADYADAMAMTQGRRLAGEPERLVLRALEIDPDHLKALALAGSAAMERGDFAAAVRHWTRVKQVAPPDSPFASGLDESLREARAAAGLPPEAAAPAPAPAPAAAAASAPGLRVRVTLAPAIAGRVQPGDTLFVFARAAEGPRLPLAIARLRAADLPAEVTLDDSMAMTPQMRLSAFDRVVVGARVSRSGDATGQAGDLEGLSAPLAPAGGAVTVEIARVLD
jgi:cytochrome c-type biogenesis protein CcmH